MAFDLKELKRLIDLNGNIVRIVVTEIKGSVPRDVGTSMVVWKDGQTGTIGGGALEYQAVKTARAAIESKSSWSSSHSLGPELGQCCGGFVKLLGEYFDKTCFPNFQNGLYARLVSGEKPKNIPLSVKRAISFVKDDQTGCKAKLIDGWFIESVAEKGTNLWVWGAGHVGRSLVGVLNDLPNIDITWIDTAEARFPEVIPHGVNPIYSKRPQEFVKYAPDLADHFILTYSHSLDFEICNALLHHTFDFAGLIGSKTKWQRFKRRLTALNHDAERVNQIKCPIGRLELGKHPRQIAIGVASDFLERKMVSKDKFTEGKKTITSLKAVS